MYRTLAGIAAASLIALAFPSPSIADYLEEDYLSAPHAEIDETFIVRRPPVVVVRERVVIRPVPVVRERVVVRPVPVVRERVVVRPVPVVREAVASLCLSPLAPSAPSSPLVTMGACMMWEATVR